MQPSALARVRPIVAAALLLSAAAVPPAALSASLAADADACGGGSGEEPLSLLQLKSSAGRPAAAASAAEQAKSSAAAQANLGPAPASRGSEAPGAGASSGGPGAALALLLQQSRASQQAGSTTATALLCLVFVVIVLCTIHLISSQYSQQGPPGAAPGPPKPSDSRFVGTGSLGRLPARPQSGGRPPVASQPLEATPGGGSWISHPEGTEDWGSAAPAAKPTSDLPTIFPQLVMREAQTRLAVPVDALREAEFKIDVLGASGVPLLSAALENGQIELSLYEIDTRLASVTPKLQLLDAAGALFGTLRQENDGGYALYDAKGFPVLTMVQGRAGEVLLLSADPGGRSTERASAVRRPKGRLPAEHYEVVVSPGVDAVLVLACFLGLVVFAQPASLA